MTNRPNTLDPFLDLIRLLRPQATLWGAIQANGNWGVGFRKREDLLFFRVDRGSCLLLRSDQEPLRLEQGELLFIRTISPFVLASDQDAKPIDSEMLVSSTRSRTMLLGTGHTNPVEIRGGRLAFETVNEGLLTQLLPPVVYVAAGESISIRTHALLAMNEEESRSPSPGSAFVVARLMELLLVEILRYEAGGEHPAQVALLRGLSDPVIGRALLALHSNPAGSWTTAALARLCGCSRSAFNLRFTSLVGVAPMQYLHRWRMEIAKEELRRGERNIAEIALHIGFHSGPAFTRAFTRSLGCAPSTFVKQQCPLVALKGGVDHARSSS